MSILQDLDPQYAKIHAQPSSNRKTAILAGTALFVLGSGYWAMTQLLPPSSSVDQTPTSYTSPAAPISDETQKNAASMPPTLVKPKTLYPMTKVASASLSATIRNDTENMTSAAQRPPASPPTNLAENTPGSLANTEYRRPTQPAASHAKTASAHRTAKSELRNTATPRAAKSEKNQSSGGKRTNERDIDIITAIVR
ncbi:hypothetical protein LZ012_11790 [Dechloromonas sp. XY25]|uniref:Uncharacterized protein n=1 Tax=Dechloromonas hankyongensis TaxID=2908002 RepID=A0ABS9K3F0_9RHOO|nr:hypothetical protein [Dechloromonas hankyongensis]MCG2577675.1 hypothetical protein [Dechloromonas hankyongensis]